MLNLPPRLCACGCGKRIEVRGQHRSRGIPKHVHGHHRMPMTAFVESLNAEGYATVAQAAKEIGVGENTLRRAEGKGWIRPSRKAWGGRRPMRVYRNAGLPGLRAKMAAAGFRFGDDGDAMTTPQASRALGMSETRLRDLAREGTAPARRDTNGKWVWRRSELDAIKAAVRGRKDGRKGG